MRMRLSGFLAAGMMLLTAASADAQQFNYGRQTQGFNTFQGYGVPGSNYVGSPYTSLNTSPQLAPQYFQQGRNVTSYSRGYGGMVNPSYPATGTYPSWPSHSYPGTGTGFFGSSYGHTPIYQYNSRTYRSYNYGRPNLFGGVFRRGMRGF